MPRTRVFYHVVWTTKHRMPVLVGEVQSLVERSIRAACEEFRAPIHALFLMPDHVHLAVSIPPSIAVATFVARLKGSSSHLVNHTPATNAERFSWQEEYGVSTFGEKQLPIVVDYIRNQTEHHAAGRLWPTAESISDDG